MPSRAVLLGVLLFAAYAATLGLDAFGDSDYAGDEPHYLLTAHSLVHDGDLDVEDDYRHREYAAFYPLELDREGRVTNGRLHEPHGTGLPLLVAPAYAIAGATGVELWLAVLAALAGVLAYLLALRVVPDPWALGAALAVGLSPPFLAYGTAVYPELTAGAALAGAALLAVRMRSSPGRLEAVTCFLLLGVLPWLGVKYLPAAIVIGAAAVRALEGARRRLLAIAGVEIAALSLVLYVTVNQALYGGPTPYAADVGEEAGTDAGSLSGYLGRAYRLVALFIDRDYGLARWAPVILLALGGAWLLVRARREGLRRAGIAGEDEIEATGALCALALGAQLLVAALLAPTMFGFWFPGRHLVAALPLAVPLVAWGLRHVPRVGTALALVGLAASAWLYLDVRLGDGGLASGRPAAPWGPLEAAFPSFDGSPLPYLVAAVAGVAVLAFLASAAVRPRVRAGAT